MAALSTVSDYVTAARILLQDSSTPYRYPDTSLLLALNLGLLEARKLRPDLYIDRSDDVPAFDANDTTAVDFDPQYRIALLYFVVGHTQLIDDEDTQDPRAAAFLQKSSAMMLAL